VEFRALLSAEPPHELAALGEHLVGDETDAATVEQLLEDTDVLVHLGRVIPSPADDFCQEELAGQATLIPAANERGLEMHFISSSEVFTPPADAASNRVPEDAAVEPASPLGVAKLAWEQTLRIWEQHHELHNVVYRVPTVVAEYLSYSDLTARYLRAGFKTHEITPRAHGADRWGVCYVHAEDVARLLADTIGRDEAYGEIFHVAADEWLSEQDLAEMSYRVLRDFMIPCKWKPPAAGGPAGLVNDVWLDNSKAKEKLGLDVINSGARLVTKLRVWVDDFGSTARLPVAQ
jgi:UDP-glucose 4-epimerase